MNKPDSALKDKDYNLVCVLEASLRNGEQGKRMLLARLTDGDGRA
ncbi:hypothetical protein WDU99_09310 [Microbacterium sp. Mu-80]|uniref:Uncharacterized protein n=1 Tax=Microbacterium bandirmense TaxID=3122050 RepID=A0ABU8LD56_9MICO